MATSNNAIIIDDDDDRNETRQVRCTSVASSASSHTIRANTPEEIEMPRIKRLSVEPGRTPHPLHNGIFFNKGFGDKNVSQDNNCKSSPDFPNSAMGGKKRPSISMDGADDQNGQRGIRRRRVEALSEPIIIDLDEENMLIPKYNPKEDIWYDLDNVEAIEGEIAQEQVCSENLTNEEHSRARPRVRDPSIGLPNVQLDKYEWSGMLLRAKKTVELNDGSFLKIETVVLNLETDVVMLRGWQLRRSRELGGVLQKKLNELCFIYDMDLDDPRSISEQSIVEVPVGEVVQVRKLVCTNHPFPNFRFDQRQIPNFRGNRGRGKQKARTYVEDHEVLVARWKQVSKFENSRVRMQYGHRDVFNNYRRREVTCLTQEECSHGSFMQAHELRRLWRGEGTVLGGSGEKKHEQVYTYGDTYSGGGGTLRGAMMADLSIKWGLDFNPEAARTLRANFQDLKVYEMWVDQFCNLPDPQKKLFVDILHLSPPCQFFSPVHTRAGQDDEMNYASLFGVSALICKARPRIVTLEQTFGISSLKKFRNAFNQLIRMFVDNGYSTSWQVVELQRFGLAGRRKRLIIVAAGPGETLPEFPAYTHSEHGAGNLQPFNTVNKVLRNIPRNATQHNLYSARRSASFVPWDGNTLAKCITTNGGELGHPDGTRGFTYRELAAIQGFPHEHFFTGNTAGTITKQIGNAVPPLFAKILFKSIISHLEKVDAVEKRGRGRGRGRG